MAATLRGQVTAPRCVHCRREIPPGQLTEDHILPDAWYPGRVPPSSRPVVPACKGCNERLGRVEKRVFEKIALTIGLDDPRFGDVARRAMRAHAAAAGRNEKDRQARGRAKDRALVDMERARRILQTEEGRRSILRCSDATTSNGYPLEERAISIPAADLGEVWRKMLLAIAWHVGGVHLDPDRDDVTIWNEGELNPIEFDRLLASNEAKALVIEDVLEVRWRSVPTHPSAALASVAIWAGRLRWWAAISPAQTHASPAASTEAERQNRL